MGKKINPEDHIGEVHGIYTIVEVMPDKDKWNHYVYKGICNECGTLRIGTYHDFKDNQVLECKHRIMLNQEQLDIWYDKNKKKCLYCGKYILLGDLSFNEYKERKFCNSSCAASYINKQRSVKKIEKEKIEKNKCYCKNCGKEIPSNKIYCSLQCLSDFKYKEYIERWKNGLVDGSSGKYAVSKRIRRYLFEKYQNKCSECGWSKINPITGKIPLEVHHKDGDYTNNDEDNLALLCPNCHALTPTYKASNKGCGRKDRKKYYLN